METMQTLAERLPQSLSGRIALLAATAHIVLYVGRAIHNLYFSPLSRVPGPFWSRISEFPHSYNFMRGDGVPYVKSIHDRYGPVVRIAPNRISYSTPTGFRTIYGKREHIKDPEMYIAPPSGAIGIMEADEVNHTRIRKYLGPAFSVKALEEQEGLIQGYVDQFIEGLRQRKNEMVDIDSWLDWTLYDMIGKLALDFDFENTINARYHPRVNNMFTNFKLMGLFYAASAYPWFYTFVQQSLKMMFARRSENYNFIQDVVKNRVRSQEKGKTDLWAYVLEHANPGDLVEKELETTGWQIVIAGAETTSTVLSGAVYLLSVNPGRTQRLVKELRKRFKSEKQISFDSVAKIPYLIAVLEETLRFYPPAAFGVSRVVTQVEGSEIDKVWLPQGTRISASQYCVFRSQDNFAKPDEFVPERWLDDHDEVFENDNHDALMPFSYGKRNCIGRSLAIVQMRLILARLLWNFDVELCDQSRDWIEQRSFLGWEKPPLYVRLTDRHHRS
ncbi:cytochrome P450 [Massarina eburnea CBS 473.64]|uniref:Cytochrome P450 n=1 Tax=Massarina eburnea CBS 473.64 TaxID=1395130 RepID=A0A6A6SFS1_9PLEO|nr:cytochrome P450 [Massarina eburnea CBS 473.64]